MGIIENAKEVAALVQQVGNADLYRRIVELQGEIVNASSEIFRLTKENSELREALALKAKMRFEEPFVYGEGDPVPYCPHCWEAKRIAVHLLDVGDSIRRCPACGQVFKDQGQRTRTRIGVRPRPYPGP